MRCGVSILVSGVELKRRTSLTLIAFIYNRSYQNSSQYTLKLPIVLSVNYRKSTIFTFLSLYPICCFCSYVDFNCVTRNRCSQETKTTKIPLQIEYILLNCNKLLSLSVCVCDFVVFIVLAILSLFLWLSPFSF